MMFEQILGNVICLGILTAMAAFKIYCVYAERWAAEQERIEKEKRWAKEAQRIKEIGMTWAIQDEINKEQKRKEIEIKEEQRRKEIKTAEAQRSRIIREMIEDLEKQLQER